MKFKHFALVFAITALFLYSCDFDVDSGPYYRRPNISDDGKSREFYAQNCEDNQFYLLDADKIVDDNAFCEVWVEKGCGVTSSQAKQIADEFDNNIYQKMMAAFGSKDFLVDGVLLDTMEYSSSLVDGNGKLTILLLDIKDGYNSEAGGGFVAGYFHPVNFLEWDTKTPSNECDMIYIDTNPGIFNSTQTVNEALPLVYRTLAHEMQHLMNFVTSNDRRLNGKRPQLMDLWIDEGLSSAAEYVYSGKHSQDRIDWYNGYRDEKNVLQPNGLIALGNNFYVWGNASTGGYTHPLSILDEYSTVYLFFQWLRLQSGGISIYKDIMTSSSWNYNAVLTAANNRITGSDYSQWDSLLRDWLAANCINNTSGRYGYMNDTAFKDTSAWVLTGGKPTDQYYLRPGEGIYTKKTTMPTATINIKYAGLTGASPYVSNTTAYAGGVLLSYNINTNVNGSSSPSSPFSVEMLHAEQSQSDRFNVLCIDTVPRSASFAQQQARPVAPYPISAGDMLRQKGYGVESTGFNFSVTGRNIKNR